MENYQTQEAAVDVKPENQGAYFGMKVMFEKDVGLYQAKIGKTEKIVKKRPGQNNNGSYR